MSRLYIKQIEGQDRLVNKLTMMERHFGGSFKRQVVDAGAKELAHLVRKHMRSYFPVLYKTGFMYKSIGERGLGGSDSMVEVGAPYAVYHEYGTRSIPARPFFRPAIEEFKRTFVDTLYGMVSSELRRIGK